MKSDPNDKTSWCNNEAKGCEKFMKKHFGRCDGEMTCYKDGRIGHYSKDFAFNDRVCYECGEKKHILSDFQKKNEATRPDVPPKAKAEGYHMILDEEERGREFWSCFSGVLE